MWNNDLGYVNLGNDRSPETPIQRKVTGFTDRMLFWLGVVIPALALLLETNYHICARHFFDPFPTVWHSFLFSLVPATNFMAWLALRANLSAFYGMILFANGTAIGVSILYTLMFLPIVPASLLYVWVFGLGLLGLAPMFSLITLWKAGKVIEREAEHYGTYFNPHQVHHLGHIAILLTIIAVELPSSYTRIALGIAAEPGKEKQGLDMLRAFGSQEVMQRACYERSGRATDIVGSLYESHNHMNVDEARHLFYRATGRTFNSFPIPESARATMQHNGTVVDDGAPTDEFDVDPDIAGEMVSGVSRGLTVSNSDIKATIDPEAAISKIDWQLSFKNKSKYDREVRTRISLPPGGAINKAALIVDGVEYEADIMVREEARQVYKEAVAAKRNPLLVSTCGEDTVLVQAFPVPPLNRNEVKLRLGIVAPLGLDSKKQGIFVLPQFEERNFQLEIPHKVEISSTNSLRPKWDGTAQNVANGSGHVVRTNLDAAKLATGGGIVEVARKGSRKSFFCYDPQSSNVRLAPFPMPAPTAVPRPHVSSSAGAAAGCAGAAAGCALTATAACISFESAMASRPAATQNVITETFAPERIQAPQQLQVVLDGSYMMSQHLDEIADALSQLPPTTAVEVFLANDDGFRKWNNGPVAANSPAFGKVLSELRREHCVGGQDNSPALESVLPVSSADAVLWIHGAQPVEGHDNVNVKAELANSSGPIYDMQIASGPNLVLDGIAPTVNIQKVARAGSVKEDLQVLFQRWKNEIQLDEQKFRRVSYYQAASEGIVPSGMPVQPVAFQSPPSPVQGEFVTLAPGEKMIFSEQKTSPPPSGQGLPHPAPVAAIADGQSQQTMPEMAQIWAYKQIMADIKRGDWHSTQEALRLAREYHVVTPLSSAILVLDVPQLAILTPQPEPEEPMQRLASDFNKYNPFPFMLYPISMVTEGLQSALSSSFSTITGQLNRLNSDTAGGSGGDQYRQSYGNSYSADDYESGTSTGRADGVGDPGAGSGIKGNWGSPLLSAAPTSTAPSAVPRRAGSPIRPKTKRMEEEKQVFDMRSAAKKADSNAVALSEGDANFAQPSDSNSNNPAAPALQGSKLSITPGKPQASLMKAKEASESGTAGGTATGNFSGHQTQASDKLSTMNEMAMKDEVANDRGMQATGQLQPQSADTTVIQGVNTSGTIQSTKPTDPISALFAKPVPESDNWLLGLVALLTIMLVALRSRLTPRKS